MLRLAVLVLPLCLDTFAVSLALGAAGLTRKRRLQVSVLFPLAEAAMPALGLLAGEGLARAIGDAADYVAVGVLIATGAFLLAEDDSDERLRAKRLSRAGGLALLALAVGIALDELALGFSIGLLRLSFVIACIMIGVQAVVASQLGLLLGSRVGARFRERAGQLAGLILVVIGIFLFFETLSGGFAAARPTTSTSLDAYRGLATWVDIYDAKDWSRPEAAVAAMKARGVRTLLLETGNYSQKTDVVRPKITGRFIDAARAQGIEIVAWYLPSFANPDRDYRRAMAAIRFRSAKGQRFDSFGLDIEASVVKNVALRNRRLLALSGRIRAAVGRSYPLGAIIPSPRGMQLLPKYWPGFPYADLALTYDVFLPMGYFSYRPTDLGGAYGYTVRNVSLIRRGTGNPTVAVHTIGGLSQDSSIAQVRAFVRATRDCGVIGASMYDFSTTGPKGWKQLLGVRINPLPSKSTCS
jgi:putative Mn2+ efflux pump MntP